MPATRLLLAIGALQLGFFVAWTATTVEVATFGWSATAVGLYAALPWASLCVVLPLAPRAIATFGHARTVRFALLLHLAAGAGFALHAPVAWWLAAAALGAGFGLRWAALDSWLVALAPAGRVARTMALAETFAGAAMFAAPPLAALVRPYGAGAAAALLTLAALAAALVVAGLPGPRVPQPGAGDSSEPPRSSATAPRTMRRPLLPAAVLAVVVLAAFASGGYESGFMASGTLLASSEGRLDDALLLATLVGGGSFATQYALGACADRLGTERVTLVCAGLLASALALLLVVPAALLPVACVVGAAGGGLYTLSVVHGLHAAAPADAPRTIALAAFAYTAGAWVLPAATGLVLDVAGPRAGVGLLFAGAVATVLAVVLAARRRGRSRAIRPARQPS